MENRPLNEVTEWIRARDSFAILPHISPDGDALGSALALNNALLSMGKRTFIACADEVPRMYGFMPQIDAVRKPEDKLFQPKWLILVDTAAPDRIGELQSWMAEVEGCAVIDHHPTNAWFGDVNLIVPEASSTGEIIADVIEALGLSYNAEMAVHLYVALSTDTGNFSFSCTTPKALRITASLLEKGLALDEINRLLFHVRSLARTRLMGAALGGIQRSDDGRIAWSVITKAMFAACGADVSETEGVVNYIKEIEGVEVALLAVERDGETKVSLRSNGLLHMGEIASEMGGGGHERAAGLTLKLPPDESIETITRTIRARLS